MRHSRLKRTAYHEAGHAVMAYWLRRRIHHVTIIPDSDSDSLGHLSKARLAMLSEAEWEFRIDTGDLSRLRQKVEGEILISFAGQVAEELLTNRKRRLAGSASDYQFITTALICLTSDMGDELTAYSNWLYERTRAILSQGMVWRAVQALAAELLTRRYIAGKQARQIIQDAVSIIVSEHNGGDQ